MIGSSLRCVERRLFDSIGIGILLCCGGDSARRRSSYWDRLLALERGRVKGNIFF